MRNKVYHTPPDTPLPAGDRWLPTHEVMTALGFTTPSGLSAFRRRAGIDLPGYPVTGDRRKLWFKSSDVERVVEARKRRGERFGRER